MGDGGWPDNFDAMKAGVGCEMCDQPRGQEANPYGVLIASGQHSDAFLERLGFRRGYTLVIHRGDRHVTEPTELSDEDSEGYWREVMAVARAVQSVYQPLKINLMMLGNQLPHLHTHIVPRYQHDADAGGPPDFNVGAEPRDDAALQEEAASLRRALRS